MSNVISITSNNSVITFDFDEKQISFLRSGMDVVNRLVNMTVPFSEITGVELRKASALLLGSACFIINNTRVVFKYGFRMRRESDAMMYRCSKKEYTSLRDAVIKLADELKIEVKEGKDSFDVPHAEYDKRFSR